MRPAEPFARPVPAAADLVREVRSEADVLAARHLVRAAAIAAGFDLVGQTKIVTAANEMARNAYVHGGGGTMVVRELVGTCGRRGLRLEVTDRGPGILDVEAALADGFSTGAGLGHGLGGTRGLVHEFGIDTAAGAGTTVTVVRWRA
ncbi:ATP-binding protein [Lentzea sp. NPDC060358]|uniref:ATP-binding protein n=1 Tax=Lentzea sp. NPDC060358 TaxID=3347103 RepID=UPI00364C1845